MKKNTLFLDRDGVINEVIMRGGEISSPRVFGEFRFKQDFLENVSKLNHANINIFIVSNQPDIARGLMKKEVLEQINIEIKKYISPIEIAYCTCDGENCICKKPNPGMINNLIEKYKLEKKHCVILGDSFKDVEAGKKSGIQAVFLETDYNKNQKVIECQKIFSLKEFFELKFF